jgi:hypothetical protein
VIRFIYIGDQILEGEQQFAFYDTVVDDFVKFGGEVVFDSRDDFHGALDPLGRDAPLAGRCVALIPPHVR